MILRIFLLIFSTLCLSGCPAMFYGRIQNDSNSKILVVPEHNSKNVWSIESNQNIEVIWFQNCIAIQLNDSMQYFQSWPLPDNVVINGVFSSSLNATYNEQGLFFVTVKGDLIQVPKIKQCKNT
jgi:hypothetical protein